MATDQGDFRSSTFCRGLAFFSWCLLIATGVLIFGGLSARGLHALTHEPQVQLDPEFFLALIIFGGGGGIAIALLGLACWMASPRRFNWALGLVLAVVALFALFIWPTPYKHYRGDKLDFVVRVNRFTGDVKYFERERERRKTVESSSRVELAEGDRLTSGAPGAPGTPIPGAGEAGESISVGGSGRPRHPLPGAGEAGGSISSGAPGAPDTPILGAGEAGARTAVIPTRR